MIDRNILERARNTDIIVFLEKHCGFTFAYKGVTYRCKQHQSLAVKNDCLSWYWHSKGIGGFGALDYLIKVENMRFREAMEAVSGEAPVTAPQQFKTAPAKTLALPESAGIPLRLYDYLCVKAALTARS